MTEIVAPFVPLARRQNFDLGKLAKKVQGAIPVVSLVSKLLSPEGGIGGEALSYNEYCRAKLDAAGGTAFGDALSRLCDDCGKEPRTVLLLAWMVYEGRGTCGFEPARSAAVRLASTGFDYEYEIYRFEQARDAAKAAAGRGRDGADEDAAAAAAAEAIATCAYGGDEVSDEMRAHIETVARATMEAV